MGYKFWVTRALKMFFGVLILLFIVQLLKQYSVKDSIFFAVTWSILTTSIFIGARLYQSNKGVECALCNDTPSAKKDEQ
jgi:hypothetical protein